MAKTMDVCISLKEVHKYKYMYKGYYLNSHNEKEWKSSDVEVSLSPALLKEAVQLSIKGDTMSVHWVICILDHSTNWV